MQLPLEISYKEFKERLRSGPQQFRAWELSELKGGVLLEGRDFECRTVHDGWIFGHVPPTGESNWIDSEKIYRVLEAQGRITNPLSPVALSAGVSGGMTESETTKAPSRAKVRKSPRRAAKKAPDRKRKVARACASKGSGRRSTALNKKASRVPRRKSKR